MRRAIAVLCLVVMSALPAAEPAGELAADEAAVATNVEKLASRDPAVREAASVELRRLVAKYGNGTSNLAEPDAGEGYWRERTAAVTPGMTKEEVHKLLPPEPGGDAWTIGSGDSHIESHRLDPHWVVTISYRNPDKVIGPPTLARRERLVSVAWPEDFTGVWITYYVNGERGDETPLENGKRSGLSIHYHDNGRKSYEQHYVADVAHGVGNGWYEDGSLSYAIEYRDGKQHGTWTHWHRNGVKSSESDYLAGEYHGRVAAWYENGRMNSERHYRRGVKHGVEASWDEAGNLHYRREVRDGQVVD